MTKRRRRVIWRQTKASIVFQTMVLMALMGAYIIFTMWATAGTELR